MSETKGVRESLVEATARLGVVADLASRRQIDPSAAAELVLQELGWAEGVPSPTLKPYRNLSWDRLAEKIVRDVTAKANEL